MSSVPVSLRHVPGTLEEQNVVAAGGASGTKDAFRIPTHGLASLVKGRFCHLVGQSIAESDKPQLYVHVRSCWPMKFGYRYSISRPYSSSRLWSK